MSYLEFIVPNCQNSIRNTIIFRTIDKTYRLLKIWIMRPDKAKFWLRNFDNNYILFKYNTINKLSILKTSTKPTTLIVLIRAYANQVKTSIPQDYPSTGILRLHPEAPRRLYLILYTRIWPKPAGLMASVPRARKSYFADNRKNCEYVLRLK